MFADDDLLPLSALAQIAFCERRCALIHLEGSWDENPYTVEGRSLHERTHEVSMESRGRVRITRALPLRSLRLGVSGKADVVEFHQVEPGSIGIRLGDAPGLWRPFPVEYKRGILRHEKAYEIQLCAQALCLEEMLSTSVPSGALFYGKSRHRQGVTFDSVLRNETECACERLRTLIHKGYTPAARYEKKCDSCSLLSLCLPKAVRAGHSARDYLADVWSAGGDRGE